MGNIAVSLTAICVTASLVCFSVFLNRRKKRSIVITDNTNTKLSLFGTFENDNLPHSSNREDFKFMASIHAPPYRINSNNRSGIDLLCIIDKSGSMQSSNRMDLVKYTVNAIINKFLKHKNDRIGIITFSNSAQTLLPLITLNSSKHSKQKALKAVSSLFCSGSTALCDGLVEGINVMKTNNSSPNLVRSIFLFTDGEANVGQTATEDIIHELIKNKPGMNCSINTFGCGAQHNAALLQSVAEQGNNGMYAYIDSEKIIAKTLAECIGGLMGIIAQNIKVDIECISSGVQIENILSKGYKYKYGADNSDDSAIGTDEGNANCGKRNVSVTINDIQSEENRDLLFELKIPKITDRKKEYAVVRVCVEYINVIRDRKEKVTEICSIARDMELEEGKEDEEKESNMDIDIQCNRLLAANSMIAADKAAGGGDLEKANKILKNAQISILNSVSSKNRFCQNLVKDIDRCLENMRNAQVYERGGGKMLKMNATSHGQQRSCSSHVWASQATYCTPVQMFCMEEVD